MWYVFCCFGDRSSLLLPLFIVTLGFRKIRERYFDTDFNGLLYRKMVFVVDFEELIDRNFSFDTAADVEGFKLVVLFK